MSEQKKPIRVMLADDHPIVMTGFAMSLEAAGMQVVGQAKTPSEAVALYAAQQPDVVILDMRFGTELTGLDAAQSILKDDPRAKIIFLSQFDQDSLIKETYRLGAHAFVTKDCDPSDLVTAVRHAHDGKLYFLPQIASRLASMAVRGDVTPQSQLDERGLEIFKLIVRNIINPLFFLLLKKRAIVLQRGYLSSRLRRNKLFLLKEIIFTLLLIELPC